MVGLAEKGEDHEESEAGSNLWRRAPVWRSAVVGAGLVTAATLVLWNLNQLETKGAKALPALSVAAAGNADASSIPLPIPTPPANGRIAVALHSVGQNGDDAAAQRGSLVAPEPTLNLVPPNNGESQRPQRQAVMAAPSTTSALNSGAGASVPVGREEEEAEARCHPHLLRAPARMPQIDISQSSEPSIGHIKLHFWVNGAGLVSREVLTAANYGTPQEQQAEMAYAKEMTFTVPNTPECSAREIELIGDFFESREPTGNWATFVRLYPRFSFTGDGTLSLRD
jgi:hypothetical protein